MKITVLVIGCGPLGPCHAGSMNTSSSAAQSISIKPSNILYILICPRPFFHPPSTIQTKCYLHYCPAIKPPIITSAFSPFLSFFFSALLLQRKLYIIHHSLYVFFFSASYESKKKEKLVIYCTSLILTTAHTKTKAQWKMLCFTSVLCSSYFYCSTN